MINIESVADQGNDLETLKALRQKIAHTIDESNCGRDIASLSRQLQLVMAQISETEEQNKALEGDSISDIVRAHAHQRVRKSKTTGTDY